MSELFERFLRDGDELEVSIPSDFYPPGTPRIEGRPEAGEASDWQTLLDGSAMRVGGSRCSSSARAMAAWTVNAAAVIRRYRPELKYRLVAVEAEPTHFRQLKQHTRANGLRRWSRAGSCQLVEAAVSRASGRDSFYVGDPRAWYGQALVRPENVGADAAVRQVQTVTLSELLEPLGNVDLIDIDIQGAELEVLAEAAPSLGQVRRVHVETHTSLIDQQLPAVFERSAGEWTPEIAIPLGARHLTPLGEADFFGGGVQLWRNDA